MWVGKGTIKKDVSSHFTDEETEGQGGVGKGDLSKVSGDAAGFPPTDSQHLFLPAPQ